MSIFVDASKRFELKLNCDVIRDAEKEIICYKISPSGSSVISCDFKARSFSEMSQIIEESTIMRTDSFNKYFRISS